MSRTGLETLFTDDDRHGLPYLKDYRVAQVTTHGHDRPITALVPTWKEFAGTMHRDNVPILPRRQLGFRGDARTGQDHQLLVHRHARGRF
jgi:hypothetical protein